MIISHTGNIFISNLNPTLSLVVTVNDVYKLCLCYRPGFGKLGDGSASTPFGTWIKHILVHVTSVGKSEDDWFLSRQTLRNTLGIGQWLISRADVQKTHI